MEPTAKAFTLFDDHYVHTPPLSRDRFAALSLNAGATSVRRYSSVPQLSQSELGFLDVLRAVLLLPSLAERFYDVPRPRERA